MVSENKADAPQRVTFDEFDITSYEGWKEEAVKSLKGAPFEKKLLTKTYEGITLDPIYTEDMLAEYEQHLHFPGGMDFVRGAYAEGYLDKPWNIVQTTDADLPVCANEQILKDMERGASAVNFDPTGPLCLENIEDIQTLLQDVCLMKIALNVFVGASALPLLGLLKARADQHENTDYAQYSGVMGADPISVYAKEGQLPASLDCCLNQMSAVLGWTLKNAPNMRTIYVQGSVYHNGGANSIQEVAAAMSAAITYIDSLLQKGYVIDDIAKQICFDFSLGANFFMEIAKLRAARMVWAQIIQAYGGSKEAAKLNVTVRNSEFAMSVYDPYVNVLRGTTQAFSGVVGGVQAMAVKPFDAALGKSDEHSRRLANNLQIMMQTEFSLLSPVDPAGGSWYIEKLTMELAEAIWTKIQDIDAKGGIISVLKDGSLQAEIAAVLDQRFADLAKRSKRLVGINAYANPTEKLLEKSCCCEKTKAARVESSAAFAAKYDKAGADAAVAALEPGDVCGLAMAFRAGANVSQITEKFNCGQTEAIIPIKPRRLAEQFEALRDATAAAVEPVKVFLCNMGPIPQHKPRADFSIGFMEVGGFQVLKNDGFPTPEAAIAAAKEAEAHVAVICSTDDTYPELVPVLAKGLKEAVPGIMVIMAGAPAPEFKETFDAAGVDQYIHIKANCLQILKAVQKERGIC